MRGQGAGEVPACRKAHDADASRIDAELLGPEANLADGALHVHERGGVQWAGTILLHDAVLQHERRDAEAVEELGDLLAFVIVGEEAVATTGTDHDRGPVRLGGLVHGHARFIGRRIAHGRGGLAVPEWDDGRSRGLAQCRRCDQESDGEHDEFLS